MEKLKHLLAFAVKKVLLDPLYYCPFFIVTVLEAEVQLRKPLSTPPKYIFSLTLTEKLVLSGQNMGIQLISGVYLKH